MSFDESQPNKAHRAEGSTAVATSAPGGDVQVALFLAYVGSSYCGLQVQPALALERTVEGRLFVALAEAGVIDFSPRTVPILQILQITFYNRGNRTDRQVHAARNVVTLRVMGSVVAGAAGVVDGLNNALLAAVRVRASDSRGGSVVIPGGSIRVLGMTQVSNEFLPRRLATRRIYRYLVPAFALDAATDGFFTKEGAPQKPHYAVRGDEVPGEVDALKRAAVHLNEHLSKFTGLHRFHNLTEDTHAGSRRFTKVKATDDASLRVIDGVEVLTSPVWCPWPRPRTSNGAAGEPTAAESRKVPYFLLQVSGNGFLMHMIRKIVGTAIAVCRGARPTLIDDALDATKVVRTPMAPGTYLWLSTPTYEGYDSTVAPSRGLQAIAHCLAALESEAQRFEWGVIAREIVAVDCTGASALPPHPAVEYDGGGEAKPRRNENDSIPPNSPMTLFVRALRMHNWAVQAAPVTSAASPVSRRPPPTDDCSGDDELVGEEENSEARNVPQEATDSALSPGERLALARRAKLRSVAGWIPQADKATASFNQVIAREWRPPEA
jgi:tRNA pseudouridine38-40 synthase